MPRPPDCQDDHPCLRNRSFSKLLAKAQLRQHCFLISSKGRLVQQRLMCACAFVAADFTVQQVESAQTRIAAHTSTRLCLTAAKTVSCHRRALKWQCAGSSAAQTTRRPMHRGDGSQTWPKRHTHGLENKARALVTLSNRVRAWGGRCSECLTFYGTCPFVAAGCC